MEARVMTAYVPLPLAAWVDQEEELHRLTLEAMIDVDNGGVIDHQSVQYGRIVWIRTSHFPLLSYLQTIQRFNSLMDCLRDFSILMNHGKQVFY